jgi:thiol-disulfide isomerase/thioredoxin
MGGERREWERCEGAGRIPRWAVPGGCARAGGPLLAEFFATWCGCYRRFAPTLEALAREYAGRVPVVQVNANQSLAVPVPEWAPVDACTLPTAQQPLREAEFNELFAGSLRGIQRREPRWLRLYLNPGAEGSARDLVARESSCCSFFDFRFTDEKVQLVLDVRVPRERVSVLDGLARQAQDARERAMSAIRER